MKKAQLQVPDVEFITVGHMDIDVRRRRTPMHDDSRPSLIAQLPGSTCGTWGKFV
jgi:hypothetical protein